MNTVSKLEKLPLLSELSEDQARGDILQIYQEIRRLSAVPMVALIWRHLATLPGTLEWAWDFLAPAMRVGLAAEGFDANVRSAAFGNWISETFDEPNATSDDLWVVWMSGMGASRGMTERPDVDVGGVAAAAQRLVARGVKVVLIHPEPLLSEDDPFSPFVAWRRGISEKLAELLPPSVVQLSVEHLVRRIGTNNWVATRYWEQAKAPCHPDAATAVGLELASVVARMLRPAVRAVAVDLDDTMWGGLVGEVGPEGLDLDPDGTGRPFIELQRLLLDVVEKGCRS